MEFEKTIDGKNYLVVKSDNLRETINYINKKDIKQILINDYRGFKEQSVDFLAECNQIEDVFLVEGNYDTSGIKYLDNLKSAIIGSAPKHSVDLSKFKGLESLSITHHKNWLNLFSCTSLIDLHIWKLPFENLLNFKRLVKLKSLELVQGKVNSLEGIDELSLTHFEAHKVSSLLDIGMYKESFSLENFYLYDCKKVQNHEDIAKAVNLKSLRYANCGIMKSISFIEKMPKLKEFRFPKTLVEDGNLSYLEKIDVVMFNDKKHYSIKYKDLFLDRIKKGLMS